MKSALFNFHDLVLLWVLAASITLALLNARAGRLSPRAGQCLTTFYLMVGLIALDTLLFWGDYIKTVAFDASPWLLTVFSFATLTAGPLLWWAIQAESSARFRWHWPQLLHLVPAIATPIYLYLVVYRYPLPAQRELLLDLGVYHVADAHFGLFVLLKKAAPVAYGAMGLLHLSARLTSPSTAAENQDSPRAANLEMLRWLAAGFTAIAGWSLLTHLCGLWLPLNPADVMGILGNYLSSALLAWLIVISIRGALAQLQRPAAEQAPSPADNPATLAAAQRIHAFMEADKPYLNPRLTLERFAALLEMSPRQVSTAINRCFGQNYHEYINRYRVEEAKRLLRDGGGDLTIADVALQAGFNSKASFNRTFKSLAGAAPSAFRDQVNGGDLPAAHHA